jgi:hypothetical protein
MQHSIVFLSVLLKLTFHRVEDLPFVLKLLVGHLASLLSRAEINIGFEITRLLVQVLLDLHQTLANHLLLIFSKLAQVVRDSLKFFLDSLLQVSLELFGLDLNKAPAWLA